jgi:tRNA modification GTPase
VEASIDFDVDDLPPRALAPELAQASARLETLLANAERGIIYRQGIRVAIVGRPNVGKSSLLNRLLGTSRAIVTDVPGTTRDTLEEMLNLQGIPVVLVDTAGIAAATRDPVERLGIERSQAALAQADLALLVLDASEPLTDADWTIAGLIDSRPAITVLNKIDLVAIEVPRLLSGLPPRLRAPAVPISALTGDGLDALEEAIVDRVLSGQVITSSAPLVTHPRHKDALARAHASVEAAQAALREGLPADCVAIDLTGAVNALGEITGQTVTDDLLETVFGKFCIGK